MCLCMIRWTAGRTAILHFQLLSRFECIDCQISGHGWSLIARKIAPLHVGFGPLSSTVHGSFRL